MKMLIIEDELLLADSLRAMLEGKGFSVEAVHDGQTGAEYAETGVYDLLILDVMMPGMDGYQVARQVRAKRCGTPILMLTAKAAESDKVLGLGLGADDYLTKPFGLAELRARVSALLRRAGVSAATTRQDDVFTFGGHTVSVPRSVLVAKDGIETELTALELGILRFLAAHPGEVVSRESLLNGLWGISYSGTTRTIDTRVGCLRQKLGTDGVLIETVYGSGYRYRAV